MTPREKQLESIADELDSIRLQWDHLLPAERAIAFARVKVLTELSQKLINHEYDYEPLPEC